MACCGDVAALMVVCHHPPSYSLRAAAEGSGAMAWGRCHVVIMLSSYCCLLLGAMHRLSIPQAVAHRHGVGAAGSLCPGEGHGGCVISVTGWVYEGGGAYLVGPPLDRPPGTVLSSIVVIVPISSPPGCQLSSQCPCLSITLPGHRVRVFGVVGLISFLRNKLNVSVSKIECEEKKKKLTLAQMMIHVIWAVLCMKWLICGHRWCWCCLCVVVGVGVDGIGVMGRERSEGGGIIIIDGGGVGKSDELAVMWLCYVSYTAMPMPLGG